MGCCAAEPSKDLLEKKEISEVLDYIKEKAKDFINGTNALSKEDKEAFGIKGEEKNEEKDANAENKQILESNVKVEGLNEQKGENSEKTENKTKENDTQKETQKEKYYYILYLKLEGINLTKIEEIKEEETKKEIIKKIAYLVGQFENAKAVNNSSLKSLLDDLEKFLKEKIKVPEENVPEKK